MPVSCAAWGCKNCHTIENRSQGIIFHNNISKTEHLFLVVFGHDIISNSNVQRRKDAKFKNTTVIVSRNVVLIVFQSTM